MKVTYCFRTIKYFNKAFEYQSLYIYYFYIIITIKHALIPPTGHALGTHQTIKHHKLNVCRILDTQMEHWSNATTSVSAPATETANVTAATATATTIGNVINGFYIRTVTGYNQQSCAVFRTGYIVQATCTCTTVYMCYAIKATHVND